MLIRAARVEDAEEASKVLRESIGQLCIADHHNNPDVLAAWLSNKTPDMVGRMIESPASHFVVAMDDGGRIAGVGAAMRSGEVTLNYVSPHARFRGVSKFLLGAIEDQLRSHGVTRCTLTSTMTAHAFYQAAGYADDGPPTTWQGLAGQPMVKAL